MVSVLIMFAAGIGSFVHLFSAGVYNGFSGRFPGRGLAVGTAFLVVAWLANRYGRRLEQAHNSDELTRVLSS